MIGDFDESSCLAEINCKENPYFLKIVLTVIFKIDNL